MKTFAVFAGIGEYSVKRSLTMKQIEVLFLVCMNATLDKHRKYFNLTMTFYNGEFNKAVTVKRLPNGYLSKFELKVKT